MSHGIAGALKRAQGEFMKWVHVFQFVAATAVIVLCAPLHAQSLAQCKKATGNAVQTCQDSFDATQASTNSQRTAQAKSYGAGKNRITGAANDLTNAASTDAGKWESVQNTCTDAKGTKDDQTGCYSESCDGIADPQEQSTARQLQQSCINNVNRNIASAQTAQASNQDAADQGDKVAASSCDESDPSSCVQQVDLKCGQGFVLVGTVATKTMECRPLFGPYSGTPLR